MEETRCSMCQTAIGLTWRYLVRQLVLASETAFDQGTLAIDKAALLQAIAEPHAIREIDIQVTILVSRAVLCMCWMRWPPW